MKICPYILYANTRKTVLDTATASSLCVWRTYQTFWSMANVCLFVIKCWLTWSVGFGVPYLQFFKFKIDHNALHTIYAKLPYHTSYILYYILSYILILHWGCLNYCDLADCLTDERFILWQMFSQLGLGLKCLQKKTIFTFHSCKTFTNPVGTILQLLATVAV